MDFCELRKKLIEKDFGGMNDRQFEAVTSVNGPLLVLAGAGSGKTTVLVNRIANLVKYGDGYQSDFVPHYTQDDINAANGYLSGLSEELPENIFSVNAPKPYEILAITFTNKAAGELKERICAKLGEKGNYVWAGTFHSICGKILRRDGERVGYTSRFTIYDSDDQKRLMKDIMKKSNIDEKFIPVKSVLSKISSAKDSLVSPDEFEASVGNDMRLKTVSRLYREYQRQLKAADAMDFDDMIGITVELFNEAPDVLDYYRNKFKYIMIDEYQDTNHAQYELVRLLAGTRKNICAVGDDDQSIYRFRGASIENILSFEENFQNAKTVRLEQNYRSKGNILGAANEVIRHNKGRKGKTLWTDKGDGAPVDVHTSSDEKSEAKYIAEKILENVQNGGNFSDNAVLYRMNAQSSAVEIAFSRSGISYSVIGGHRFYDRKEIKDLLAYLCVINNPSDSVRLKRIINEPKRGIGETTVNNASNIADMLGIPLFEVFKTAADYPTISKAAAKLKDFCNMIEGLSSQADETPASELAEQILDLSGYRNMLLADDSPDSPDRLGNAEQLISNIKDYEKENNDPTIEGFLENVALINDIDSMNESDDKVVMMTVHSAKGLEFDNVFIVGMEEGIFPGTQSIYGGESEIEEERRLAYVAITRAKNHLTITKAYTRMLFGSTARNLPSRFLNEIPLVYINETCDQTDIYRRPYSSSYGVSNTDSGLAQKGSGVSESAYRPQFEGRHGTQRRSIHLSNAETASAVSASAAYSPGQTVEHSVFGRGMIIKVTPMGNDNMLEIAFDDVGTKKIMANFAKLKIN